MSGDIHLLLDVCWWSGCFFIYFQSCQKITEMHGSVGSTLALYTVDPGSNPGTGRYIVARMTTLNGGPLSLGPIPSGRLKILGDVDNWSSPSLCLQLGE